MKTPKFIGNIKAWFKRNIFITPLKPRTVLAFSFLTIIITILPVFVLWFSIIGMLDANILYNDEVNVPTIDIVGIILLMLIIVTAFIISIVRIVKICLEAYKRRKPKKENKESIEAKQ